MINVETLVGDNLYPQRGKHYCLPEDRDRRIPLCVFQLSRSRLTRQCRLSVRHGQSTTSHGIGFPNPTIPPSFHVCHGLKEQESAGIFRESPPPPKASWRQRQRRQKQNGAINNLALIIYWYLSQFSRLARNFWVFSLSSTSRAGYDSLASAGSRD